MPRHEQRLESSLTMLEGRLLRGCVAPRLDPVYGLAPGRIRGKRCFYEAQFAFVLLCRDDREAALPDGLPVISVNLANRTG